MAQIDNLEVQLWEEAGSIYILLPNAGHLYGSFKPRPHYLPIRGGVNDSALMLRFDPPQTANAPEDRLVDKVSSVTQDRRDNYGRPLINFLRIAMLWDVYLKGKNHSTITPLDVAQMMTLLKVARSEHSFQNDNILDILGYQDCLDDMNRHMQELGHEGVADFENFLFMDYIDLLVKLANTPE